MDKKTKMGLAIALMLLAVFVIVSIWVIHMDTYIVCIVSGIVLGLITIEALSLPGHIRKRIKFNMFSMLKKYQTRHIVGGVSFTSKKLDEIYKILTNIDNETESDYGRTLTYDDKNLLKNLALIKFYPFDPDQCQEKLKSWDSTQINELNNDTLDITYRQIWRYKIKSEIDKENQINVQDFDHINNRNFQQYLLNEYENLNPGFAIHNSSPLKINNPIFLEYLKTECNIDNTDGYINETFEDLIKNFKFQDYLLTEYGIHHTEGYIKQKIIMFDKQKNNPITTKDLIAFFSLNGMKHNYNDHETNLILIRLISQEANIQYDVFKCNKNIISLIINDSQHRKYLYMFYGRNELAYLRSLYLLINFLEYFNPFENKEHYRLTENDIALINVLKKFTSERSPSYNVDIQNISGIMKLKISSCIGLKLDLNEIADLLENLRFTAKEFKKFYSQLSIQTNDLYKLNKYFVSQDTTRSYFTQKREVDIDGAEEANALLSTDEEYKPASKDCPAKGILENISNLDIKDWCFNGKISKDKLKIVHPDRNLGCYKLGEETFKDISNLCENPITQLSDNDSNVDHDSNKNDTIESNAVVLYKPNINAKQLNDVIYFNQNISIDEDFKKYLTQFKCLKKYYTSDNYTSDQNPIQCLGNALLDILSYFTDEESTLDI